MLKLLKKIHFYYLTFCILFFFVLFAPLYYFGTRNPKFYGLLNKFRSLNSLITTALAGIFFNFKYQEKLIPNQTYIYCANHTSNLDIMIFCLLAKGRFHFMGKEELMKNPVLGMFFRSIDIPVARESKISAFRAFKRAAENLENGMSLIIFPEGKIDDIYPPTLHEFKNGPFRLAIEKKIPILPISVINAWQIMWDDGTKHGTKPGICDVYIHKAIPTDNLTVNDADLLKEQVYQQINSKLIA